MKILIIEDDEAIGMGLKYSFEKEGYEAIIGKTKAQALSLWENNTYDLCILDINLPDGNGYEICKYIKSHEDVPIIFLTASDAEVNVVMGLEMGADDYICKPFRINELMARIRTVLRRAGKNNASNDVGNGIIQAGNMRIYTNEAKVSITDEKSGQEKCIDLTALEYRLLLTLCNNRGMVLSRTQLLQDMWDVNEDFVNDNTLTVYIKRLRDKIEADPVNPKIIKTVRGLGYIVDK